MKKPVLLLLTLICSCCFISGCKNPEKAKTVSAQVSAWPRGITYEIFVQSFCDSNNDGIGDIKGMTSRLDYLQNLGVGGIWLMPMNPSPSYHKYDVTDYYGIHPDYGTLADFKEFVREAHQRNIKVVMDLVLNHSSSEHPWFKAALQNAGSPYRDYYVWVPKNDPQTKAGPGKLAGDSNNRNQWHTVPGQDSVYYGFFWGGMPDLNLDNPQLREELFKIGRFWLSEIDVDGFRLDAARHIYPDERATDNHQWWVQFRNEMQKAKKDVYLVGEVWAEADVATPYLAGLPALFNFDMGFVLTKAVNQEKAGELTANHKKIRALYKSVNPNFVDATFLTNHDQNRIMSAVNNDVNKAKMAAALLFTLPGSPYIYYGEEIGMRGVKPDEFIREPFLWDVKAQDQCRTTWQKPKYSTDTTVVPLALQLDDKNSVYNHYKTFISLRNNSPALTYGEIEPINIGPEQISAFIRNHNDESLAVLHNLSGQEVSFTRPAVLKDYKKIMFNNKNADLKKDEIKLPAYSTVILKK